MTHLNRFHLNLKKIILILKLTRQTSGMLQIGLTVKSYTYTRKAVCY
jgi:hypothetical protein